MIDEFLTKQMARSLRGVGTCGVKKPTLFNLAECDIGRPLTTAEADVSLTWLMDHGYVHTRTNEFGFEVFWITEAGKNWIV